MVKLNEDFIFRLKTICDITTVVSNYLELKFSGKNKKCCCPFHSEKTPSFLVFEETNSFYCFGCGAGGDVITFIEKIENLEYIEAVKFLCKMAGIEIEEEETDNEKLKLKRRILEINKEAAKFFFSNLTKKEGRKGLYYLAKKRGLTKKTIVKWGLGVSLNGWSFLKDYLRKKGYSYEEMLACDLILKSKNGGFYDKFRDRVMFPIIDLRGDIIGFGGRNLSEIGPKYLNSSDTLVFKKSFGLYGMNIAKNSRYDKFLLCEGYLDVLTLHQNGFDSAIATLGTSLTKEQARLIFRSKKDVVLAYDMDNAGRIAVKRASLIFDEVGIRVKVLKFDSAKDPDEFVKKFGVEKFKRIVLNAESYEKIQFDSLNKKYDLRDSEQKRKYIEEFCEIIAKDKDSLKREIEINRICQELNIDKFSIKNHVNRLIDRQKKFNSKNLNRNLTLKTLQRKKENESLPIKVVKAQEGILRFLYNNQDRISEVEREIDESYFNIEWHKKVFCFLIEAIKEKKSLDFSAFHDILEEHYFGEFIRIVNDKRIDKNILVELEDYLDVLKKFKKENKNVKDMTIAELENMMKIEKEKKR